MIVGVFDRNVVRLMWSVYGVVRFCGCGHRVNDRCVRCLVILGLLCCRWVGRKLMWSLWLYGDGGLLDVERSLLGLMWSVLLTWMRMVVVGLLLGWAAVVGL